LNTDIASRMIFGMQRYPVCIRFFIVVHHRLILINFDQFTYNVAIYTTSYNI